MPYQAQQRAESLRKVVFSQDKGGGSLTLHGDVIINIIIAHRADKVVILHHKVGDLQHNPVHLIGYIADKGHCLIHRDSCKTILYISLDTQ